MKQDEINFDTDLSLTLTLDKFKELFKKNQIIKDSNLKYLIKTVYYKAKVENNSILMKMNLSLESYVDEYQIIYLIPQNAILKDKTIPKTIFFGVIYDKYTLLINKKGLFELEFEIYIPFNSEKRKNGFTFFSPSPGKFNLIIPLNNAECSILSNKNIKYNNSFNDKNNTEIETDIPYGEIDILWKEKNIENLINKSNDYKSAGKNTINSVSNGEKNIKKENAIIYSQIQTEISINETLIQCNSHISYKIYKAGVDTFELEIIKGKIINIDGYLINNYDIKTDKNINRIVIYTKELIYEEFDFIITYEENLNLDNSINQIELQIPKLKLININRELGKILLSSATNIELSIIEQEKLTKIDIADLPSELKSDIALGSLFAFQYLSTPYSLNIKVVKHEELPIVVAIIDYAVINSLLLKEGKVLNQINFKIRNNSLNFLKFHLNKKITPISSIVNNEVVKPVKGDDNSIMIPIEKGSNGEKVFNIKFLFNIEIEKMKENNYLEIKIGYLDIPVKELFWNLYLPEDYKYKKFKGSLEQEDYFDILPQDYRESIENYPNMSVEIAEQGKQFMFKNYFLNNEEIILGIKYKKIFNFFNKNNVEPL